MGKAMELMGGVLLSDAFLIAPSSVCLTTLGHPNTSLYSWLNGVVHVPWTLTIGQCLGFPPCDRLCLGWHDPKH